VATTVDELVIKVTADLDQLKREMAKANQVTRSNTAKMTASLKSFGDSLRGPINRVGRFATALGGAAVALVSVKSVVDSLNGIDSLAKTSDKLGIATEKLQALRLAAELSGVSADTLDMALQRMVRRVSEASLGTGEAVNALKELGLSATDLARKAPDEQMKDIADAMALVDGEASKVRLSMKLFDSEGVALVNTLKGGSAALTAIEGDLAAMGAAISRVDAAKVEAANDAMTKMKTQLAAISNTIAIDIAEPLQAFVESFGELASELAAGEDALFDIGEVATSVLGMVLDAVQGVATGFLLIERIGNALQLAMADAGEEEKKVLAEAVKLKEEWTDLTEMAASTKMEIKLQEIQYKRANDAAMKLLETQANIAVEAEAAAESAAAQYEAEANAAGASLGAQYKAELDAQRDAIAEKLDVLREGLKSETLLRVEAAEEQRDVLRLAEMNGLVEQREALEMRNAIQAELDEAMLAHLAELNGYKIEAQVEEVDRTVSHLEQLLGIEQTHINASNRLWKSGLQGRLQLAQQFFSSFTPLMDSESRKAFEIGKAGAIAEAGVNTSLGAIKAYQAMAGIPIVGPALGIAAAGAVVATGMQTINQIRNTQFTGGGTTPTSPGSAGGAGSVATTPSENRQTNIRLENIQDNQQYSGGSIRSLAVALNEEVGNNVTIGVG